MKIEFLEYLALKSGCMYISDIKACRKRPVIAALLVCIQQVAPIDCSPQEWNEAIQYIAGEDVHFEDSSMAKRYLLKVLDGWMLKTRSNVFL